MNDYDRMVRAYIAMRDARSDLKRDYEEKDFKIKQQMQQLEAVMLSSLHESGAESIRTEHGTIYTVETAKASVADWSALGEWIVKHDALDFLERRVKSSEVTNYLSEYGELPPGVNLHRELNVRIRKS